MKIRNCIKKKDAVIQMRPIEVTSSKNDLLVDQLFVNKQMPFVKAGGKVVRTLDAKGIDVKK